MRIAVFTRRYGIYLYEKSWKRWSQMSRIFALQLFVCKISTCSTGQSTPWLFSGQCLAVAEPWKWAFYLGILGIPLIKGDYRCYVICVKTYAEKLASAMWHVPCFKPEICWVPTGHGPDSFPQWNDATRTRNFMWLLTHDRSVCMVYWLVVGSPLWKIWVRQLGYIKMVNGKPWSWHTYMDPSWVRVAIFHSYVKSPKKKHSSYHSPTPHDIHMTFIPIIYLWKIPMVFGRTSH